MKVVLDMNISPIWEKFLNDAGHEAIHWSKIGNIRAEDTEIMQWAKVNRFIVFTHDLDFSGLLYATGAKAPSVIQLRVENILPSSVGNVVLEALQVGSEPLKNGALITIDPRRQRIRILPLA
jgi:predicted nuclease of predicted toxin-antitoxin system